MAKSSSKGVASGTTSTSTSTTVTSGWTKGVPAISSATNKNQEIDGVLSGVKWNVGGTDWTSLTGLSGPLANSTISFSFPDSWTDYGKSYGSNEHRKNFGSFKEGPEQVAFYNVLAGIGAVSTTKTQAKDIQYISAVTPLTFLEFTAEKDASAILRFGKTDMRSAEAWAYYPSSSPTGGDAWFSNQYMNFSNLAIGTYDYTVLMHELGHSLGLKHSFENTSYGLVPIDSLSYTVMSYSSYPGGDNWYGGTNFDFPQTLMMYDIAALQHMYGANWQANAGATTYTWTPTDNKLTIQDGSSTVRYFDPLGDKVYQTLWDGDGLDTYNLAAFKTALTVDLRPGEWVNFNNAQLADIDGTKGSLLAPGNVANALTVKTYDAAGNVIGENLQSLIENAIGGTAGDDFIANRAENRLTGGTEIVAAGELKPLDIGDDFIWVDAASLLNGNTSAVAATGWDWILDFQVGVDEIDLTALAVNEALSRYDAETKQLTLVGNDGFDFARINVAIASENKTFDPGLWFV